MTPAANPRGYSLLLPLTWYMTFALLNCCACSVFCAFGGGRYLAGRCWKQKQFECRTRFFFIFNLLRINGGYGKGMYSSVLLVLRGYGCLFVFRVHSHINEYEYTAVV